MAATELSVTSSAHPASPLRAWLYAYAAVWSATLTAAAVVLLVGAPLSATTRGLLALSLHPGSTPTPTLRHMGALAAHNIPTAAWPLLLPIVGAARRGWSRITADTLLAACLIANTMPVGAAIAAYGSALAPYIPQLPLEWAGLALGAAAWLLERHQALSIHGRLRCLALIVVVLTSAAALETFAVPHETQRASTSARRISKVQPTINIT